MPLLTYKLKDLNLTGFVFLCEHMLNSSCRPRQLAVVFCSIISELFPY